MDHLANGLVETLLPETLMGSMSMSSFWTSIEKSPGGDQPTSWTQVGAHVGHPAEGLAGRGRILQWDPWRVPLM